MAKQQDCKILSVELPVLDFSTGSRNVQLIIMYAFPIEPTIIKWKSEKDKDSQGGGISDPVYSVKC